MSETADPAAGMPEHPLPQAFVSSRARTRSRGLVWRIIGYCCSVRSAAVLIATLGVVIGGATVYETNYGREATAAMIYHSWWFAGLFLLLAGNIAGAALVRWPWQRRQYGFVVVHCGLLTLIVGFFQAGNQRLDGQLIAPPEREVSELELPSDSVSVALPGANSEQRASAEFSAISDAGYPSLAQLLAGKIVHALAPADNPGVHALPKPRQLLHQDHDGIDLFLTGVCDSARADPGFLPCSDGDGAGTPALQLSVSVHAPTMPKGVSEPMDSHWLSPSAERVVAIGPFTITIERTREPLLVQDFLSNVPCEGARGVVHLYWQGQAHALAVPARFPQLVEVTPTVAVEFTKYIPNPKIESNNLEQDPTQHLDPFVEMRLGTGAPDQRVWRKVVLSAHHLLPAADADGPELLYDHPLLHQGSNEDLSTTAGNPGADKAGWLQALCGPHDTLYLRWFTRSKGFIGSATIAGAHWSGDLIGGNPALVAAMRLHAEVSWLPHAIPGPEAVAMQVDHMDQATRWVRLEARKDGIANSAWIARGGAVSIDLGGSEVLLRYDFSRYSLKDHHGFALKLKHFDEGQDPGSEHAASYASTVEIIPISEAERSAATTRLHDAESLARERLAHDPLGVWLPPALITLLHGGVHPPPVVAGSEELITMNAPLTVGGATIYQTSFSPELDEDGQPTGRQISVFTVAADPGRWCKYIGSALLVGGILLMYLMRQQRWQA